MNINQLKILALSSMFFDHFIRIFPLVDWFLPLAEWLSSIGHEDLSIWVITWIPHSLVYFGRVAAPVFMFCIVEGFFHTRDIKKYILRVFATGILAQIPYILFDLIQDRLYGITGDWKEVPLNILFTLSLGLVSLWGFDSCKKKGHTMLGLGIIVLAGALARLLKFEGSEGYVFLIFLFYLTRKRRVWEKALIFIAAIPLSRYRLIAYTTKNPAMLHSCLLNAIGPYLGILALCFYNGEKGETNKNFQRFMYAFYPLHLLLLAMIGYLRTPHF